MRLPRIDQAIEVCNRYLSASGGAGTEFEIYITRYIQVLIYASYEQEIRRIIEERTSGVSDPNIQSFFISCIGVIVRSIKTSELVGLLNRFSSGYGERFQTILKSSIENQRAETRYNNLVRERHVTAHDTGSSMTFRDLIQSYEESHIILDIFSNIILQKQSLSL